MRYTHQYQCIYLINNPEPVQYHIYAMAFPFDLRCVSVTYNVHIHTHTHTHKHTDTHKYILMHLKG